MCVHRCRTQTSTTASAGANEIKPINCLPISKVSPVSTSSCAAGTQGLLVGGSTMTLGQTAQVGGKRITAPRVTGGGVASKQPSRLPPRAAALSLEDVDVSTAQGEASDNRSPADRCHQFPIYPMSYVDHVCVGQEHSRYPAYTGKANCRRCQRLIGHLPLLLED